MPAPVQQPEPTASAPVTQEGRYGVEDAIAAITHDAVAQTIAENTPAPETPARNERGQFVKADGTPSEQPPAETPAVEQPVPANAPVAEVPPGETPATDEPIELPEGFVAVPKLARELAMPFKVMDTEGELEVPDMVIEFNANGKVRKEPLDKVVKLASMGVYNHEREQQVQASRAEVQQTQAQMQQVIAYAQRLEQERSALLSNDDAYLIARAQYEKQNTPEAKLAQAQQQMQEQNYRQGFMQAADQGQRFFASELEPAVQSITTALPTVSTEEIGAKLLLITDRFKVHTPFGSIVDPAQYPAIRQAVINELVPWAQQVHDAREADRRTTAKQTDTEKQTLQKVAQSAQVEAQKAKNLVGRVAKPGSGRTGKETPQPKPIRTVDDAEQAALAETMAAMGFSKAS